MGYKKYRNYNDIGLFDLILRPIINEIKPKIKGVIGETEISLLLAFLDTSKYKTINDIILKIKNKTSQIDHVIISNYGIFVIETKNYKGIIFGNDQSTYWTQVLYGSKVKFFNPVMQNSGHIHALKEILSEYRKIPFYSIVVFEDDAELKVNSANVVGYPLDMLDFIKSCNEVVISDAPRDKIFEKLSSIQRENRSLSQEHADSIKNELYVNEMKINKSICPKCGGRLVHRTGKYGSFIGCSNYPECKFTSKDNKQLE